MKQSTLQAGRRRFLRAVPAAVAATVSLPAAMRAQRGAGAPPKFGKDVLKCAEQIDGLSFTDAQEELAVSGVSRNLDSYEELRKLDVPLDTEPAITFRPYLPGKRPAGRSTRHARLITARPAHVQVTSSLEDLAFAPVTTLASLLHTRRARAGGRGGQGNQGRQVPRSASRHPVRREGSVRHQGDQDNLGCEAVREPCRAGRRDHRRAPA